MDVLEYGQRLLQAASWDISGQVGVRRNIATGTSTPFVGVTFSKSLGLGASETAGAKTVDLARKLAVEQHEGDTAQVERLLALAKDTRSLELGRLSTIEQRRDELRAIARRVGNSTSVDALRTLRAATVEGLYVEADLAESRSRHSGVVEWLSRQSPAQ